MDLLSIIARCDGRNLMEIDELAQEVRAHEERSQRRYESLQTAINTRQESKMAEPVEVKNIFQPAPMPAYGGGMGGDGMGGLLALALLGGGLNRQGVGDACGAEKVAVMNAGFDGINHNINTSTIGLTNQLTQGFTNQSSLDLMAKLGSIEGAIPLAGAQTQLALAGSTAALQNTMNVNASAEALASALTNQAVANSTATTLSGQVAINKNISEAIAASLASQSAIKESVAAYGVANLTATKDAQYAITAAVVAENTTTRTLINQLNTDNLNRLLTVADLDRRDEANRGRVRESEINITNNNTAIAAQAQQQAQGQQQLQFLAQLGAEVRNLANDVQVVRQTQSNVNFGTQTGTAQTASAANNKVG